MHDHLIVGVTTDELSVSVKNKKPIIPFEERLQIVSCIRYVNQAVPQFSYDKLEAYHKYKFHKMFVGDDWKGSQKWNELEHSFKSEGVEIIYFPYTKGRSSTLLRAKLTGTEMKTLKNLLKCYDMYTDKEPKYNSTILKFLSSENLIREFRHWILVYRYNQLTMYSMILLAKSNETNFYQLDNEEVAELGPILKNIEATLCENSIL